MGRVWSPLRGREWEGPIFLFIIHNITNTNVNQGLEMDSYSIERFQQYCFREFKIYFWEKYNARKPWTKCKTKYLMMN